MVKLLWQYYTILTFPCQSTLVKPDFSADQLIRRTSVILALYTSLTTMNQN